MLSTYLPPTLCNDIYLYMPWDTLYYHSVPGFIWKRLSQKEKFSACTKYSFIRNILNKYKINPKPRSHLFTDKRFVRLAIQMIGGYVLGYVDDHIKTKDIVLEAVRRCPGTVIFSPVFLWNDFDIVWTALMSSGLSWSFKAVIPTGNVCSLVGINPGAICFMNQTKELILDALKYNGEVFMYVDKKYREDPEIALEACKNWDIRFVDVHKMRRSQTYPLPCEDLNRLCKLGRDTFLEYVEQNQYRLSYKCFMHAEMLAEMDDGNAELFFNEEEGDIWNGEDEDIWNDEDDTTITDFGDASLFNEEYDDIFNDEANNSNDKDIDGLHHSDGDDSYDSVVIVIAKINDGLIRFHLE